MALRCRGVRVHLSGVDVLSGVDLTLSAGEVLVLAGRNGAGKTTLLRVVARLHEAAAGEVELLGCPLSSYSRRALAQRLALVPQEASVPFPFRVAEVVLMGRAPHLGWLGFESRVDQRIAQEALTRVGIASLAERSILEISGGERQLVMLARALAQDTPVLLLDEPTAHLDLAWRLRILEIVRELAAEGRAVLLVSHDLGLSARVGDRIALLAGGRISAEGRPEEALQPAHLEAAFGVETEVIRTADGAPVVVPRRPSLPPSC